MEAPPSEDEAAVGPNTAVAVRADRIPATSARRVLAVADRPFFAWQTGSTSIVATGAAARIEAEGPDRFGTIKAQAGTVFDQCDPPEGLPEAARPRFYGGFAFTDRAGTDSVWRGFPAAWFVLPTAQVVQRDGDAWLTVTATGPNASTRVEQGLEQWRSRIAGIGPPPAWSPPGVAESEGVPTKAGWRRQVDAALAQVDSGALEKVVLARSLRARLEGALDLPNALSELGKAYPDCYRFAVAPRGEGTFFGATPERLVTRNGRRLETEALAGSTGRGDTPAEDEWLADDLRESAKDRHEHQLAVDAIRDQLRPLASNLHTGPLSVRRLATVQHLRTEIAAELLTDDHVLSLVEALHPTPTVGGLPPEAALETISETETFDRGWYAGPVGWFDGTGDGEFAVAIRSAMARGDAVTCFAGAGIVADSDPDREWEEVQLKYRPILDVLE